MNTADKVIKVASDEVGYLEKSKIAYQKNPDIIYEKTAGAGNELDGRRKEGADAQTEDLVGMCAADFHDPKLRAVVGLDDFTGGKAFFGSSTDFLHGFFLIFMPET